MMVQATLDQQLSDSGAQITALISNWEDTTIFPDLTESAAFALQM